MTVKELHRAIKEAIETVLPNASVHNYEQMKLEYLYLCEGCNNKLVALDIELWQLTMSSLHPEPCYFCSESTRDFYEPPGQ